MEEGYKKLISWQKSIDLVQEIYLLTGSFPKEELFGLTTQLRRAAISIPSNIAEGYSRFSRKELARYLKISFGSASEVETQLIIAKRLNCASIMSIEKCEMRVEELKKIIYGHIRSLESSEY